MKPLSAAPEENEFLLQKDTLFHIRNMHRNPDGKWVVVMKVVGNQNGAIDMKKSETVKTTRQPEQVEKDRADRFTWKPGDLVFYSSKEECEKAAAKEGRKVVWY